MANFSAKLAAPGGEFKITENGITWTATDQEHPPNLWGFPTLDLAQAYFTQVLKTIHAAQEARRGR